MAVKVLGEIERLLVRGFLWKERPGAQRVYLSCHAIVN